METGVDGAFADGRSPAEVDAELAQSATGRTWLEELEAIKDPWFNMATGDGLYHYYRSWKDDPSIPYASIAGHISAIHNGRLEERPTEELARERERIAEGYAALLSDEQRGPFTELLNLSRTVFPYVEEHKFYCDYWFLTSWYNKVREFGTLLADGGYLEDSEDPPRRRRGGGVGATRSPAAHVRSARPDGRPPRPAAGRPRLAAAGALLSAAVPDAIEPPTRRSPNCWARRRGPLAATGVQVHWPRELSGSSPRAPDRPGDGSSPATTEARPAGARTVGGHSSFRPPMRCWRSTGGSRSAAGS